MADASAAVPRSDSPAVRSRVTGREAVTVGLMLAGALALRLWGLSSESVWLDEATSVFLAKMPLARMVDWTAVDIHPPLYYALLHFWLALGDGEWQIRLLSVALGVFSVAVLYALARRLFNVWVAIAASLLLATSPLHVWYSQEARMYSMLAFLGLITSYFMLKALLDQLRVAWLLYALCAVLMVYTHYYGFFILLAEVVFVAYLFWHGDINRQYLLAWLALQAVVAVAFLPWLPIAIRQVRGGGGAWVAQSGVPGLGALTDTALNFTIGLEVKWYPAPVRRAIYVAFAVLILAGIALPRRRTRATMRGVVYCVLYLALPIVLAWLLSQVKPLYSIRYLLPFVPAYYILVSQGLENLRLAGSPAPATQERVRRLAWTGVLALLVGSGLMGVIGSATHEQSTDWRGIASYIVGNAQPGDVVLFVPGWNGKPFDYYAQGRVDLQVDHPIPLHAEDIAAVVAQVSRGHRRLWLVQSDGHYLDPTSSTATYLDSVARRIERRRFFDQITVSLYQLNP
jgi:mannosyltransferase